MKYLTRRVLEEHTKKKGCKINKDCEDIAVKYG